MILLDPIGSYWNVVLSILVQPATIEMPVTQSTAAPTTRQPFGKY